MKCPVDSSDLVMSERQGIEIDYCPKCRGVWLDRGELDKIIERSAAESEPRRGQVADPAYGREGNYGREPDYGSDRDYRGGHDYKRRKKKSLLGDLFDFD